MHVGVYYRGNVHYIEEWKVTLITFSAAALIPALLWSLCQKLLRKIKNDPTAKLGDENNVMEAVWFVLAFSLNMNLFSGIISRCGYQENRLLILRHLEDCSLDPCSLALWFILLARQWTQSGALDEIRIDNTIII